MDSLFTEPKWANLLRNACFVPYALVSIFIFELGIESIYFTGERIQNENTARMHRASRHAQIQIQMHNFSLASTDLIDVLNFFCAPLVHLAKRCTCTCSTNTWQSQQS